MGSLQNPHEHGGGHIRNRTVIEGVTSKLARTQTGSLPYSHTHARGHFRVRTVIEGVTCVRPTLMEGVTRGRHGTHELHSLSGRDSCVTRRNSAGPPTRHARWQRFHVTRSISRVSSSIQLLDSAPRFSSEAPDPQSHEAWGLRSGAQGRRDWYTP